MLAYAPIAALEPIPIVRDVQLGARDKPDRTASTSASETDAVRELRVGGTEYRLLRPVQLAHSWSEEGWVCWARDAGLPYRGRGATVSEARRDWTRQFHADFQGLYAKRPFEMQADEVEGWHRLLALIDVQRYRAHTPVVTREIGCVRYGRLPYPSMIRWIDGRRDRISLEQVPPEVAGFRPGQWIEAVVQRAPTTNELIRIDNVWRIQTIHSPGDLEQEWRDLPVAELPASEWTWPPGKT